jgi:hypothetical protein
MQTGSHDHAGAGCRLQFVHPLTMCHPGLGPIQQSLRRSALRCFINDSIACLANYRCSVVCPGGIGHFILLVVCCRCSFPPYSASKSSLSPLLYVRSSESVRQFDAEANRVELVSGFFEHVRSTRLRPRVFKLHSACLKTSNLCIKQNPVPRDCSEVRSSINRRLSQRGECRS